MTEVLDRIEAKLDSIDALAYNARREAQRLAWAVADLIEALAACGSSPADTEGGN